MTEITIALEQYDRHVPFFLQTVKQPERLKMRALDVGMGPPRRHGVNRHARFLKGEFDVAEYSLASYIVGIERGMPLTAVPVFPRRLFSQNHIFVNARAGVEKPADLAGRRVGVIGFQVTLSVLAKGDLQSDYGVPWNKIHWVTASEEEIPMDYGITLERAKRPLEDMLSEGQIDALIVPRPPSRVIGDDPPVRRLFIDSRSESVRYYKKYGWYPIMHLLAFRHDLADRLPDLPRALISMWEEAKHQTEAYYNDPGYGMLAFSRNELENQRETLGADLWPSGVKANRGNLERFIEYCVDQRLIKTGIQVERLFHDSVLDT